MQWLSRLCTSTRCHWKRKASLTTLTPSHFNTETFQISQTFSESRSLSLNSPLSMPVITALWCLSYKTSLKNDSLPWRTTNVWAINTCPIPELVHMCIWFTRISMPSPNYTTCEHWSRYTCKWSPDETNSNYMTQWYQDAIVTSSLAALTEANWRSLLPVAAFHPSPRTVFEKTQILKHEGRTKFTNRHPS